MLPVFEVFYIRLILVKLLRNVSEVGTGTMCVLIM
jgi:hypothetical protein